MPTDTQRLDWLTSRDAFVAWTREGEHCRVFYRSDDDFEPICGWPVFFEDARSAIDAAMLKVQNSELRPPPKAVGP